jgi:hypothetical protein
MRCESKFLARSLQDNLHDVKQFYLTLPKDMSTRHICSAGDWAFRRGLVIMCSRAHGWDCDIQSTQPVKDILTKSFPSSCQLPQMFVY